MVYFNRPENYGATTALEDSVKGLIDFYAKKYPSRSSHINSEELFSGKNLKN